MMSQLRLSFGFHWGDVMLKYWEAVKTDLTKCFLRSLPLGSSTEPFLPDDFDDEWFNIRVSQGVKSNNGSTFFAVYVFVRWRMLYSQSFKATS